ncbi:hypothetical protein [Spiroplasma endosymbiont of Ammophila pubescens]|uniref:hypothetical protein n=1 Tax=Spiroplasma endosymbiont of Ammophila pubescens TaxID=3066315 RepID=UPI0032B1FBB3
MMNLKELLNELFDNYPEAAQDYSLDIWDRYYLEFERKRLTDEEFENLKQVYFSKQKNKNNERYKYVNLNENTK